VIEKLSSMFVLSIRGEQMKNVTHSFVFLAHWPFAGSFGLNTDILATKIINLTVVVGVLIFFGKGVLKDLLDNRKQRILRPAEGLEISRRRRRLVFRRGAAAVRRVPGEFARSPSPRERPIELLAPRIEGSCGRPSCSRGDRGIS